MKNKFKNLKEAFLDLFRKVELEPAVEAPQEDLMLEEADEDRDFRNSIVGDFGPIGWYMTAGWPDSMTNTPTNDDDTVWLVMKMDARAFMFHVSTWMELNGIKRNDICVTIKELIDPNTFNRFNIGILLLQKKEAELFREWWSGYCAQFGIDTHDRKHVFPEIPSGYNLNASAIKHAGAFWHKRDKTIVPTTSMYKQWCWIVEHCKGKVWVTNTHFMFEDDSDGVHYMLSDDIKNLTDQYFDHY
jgi:hypothetical protein